MKYSNNMQDVYKNTDEYNTGKTQTILTVFDDMIADMTNNKKNLTKCNWGRNFYCFFYKIIFCSSKICYAELYALLYYKNSK